MTQNIKFMSLDIRTPLPAGPVIQGQATTNLSPGLNMSIKPASNGVSPLISALANLSGSLKGSGIVGSAIGLVGDLISESQNRKFQREMYATQRQDALEDYERQRNDYLTDLASERLYNSPIAQVSRLQAAGINPNIAAGAGSVANTSSQARPMSPVAQSSFGNPAMSSGFGSRFLSDMSGLISSNLTQMEGRSLAQKIENDKASMLYTLAQIPYIEESTKATMISNGWQDVINSANVKEKQAATQQILKSIESQAINDYIGLYGLKLTDAQVSQYQASTAKLFSEIQSITQQYQYFESVKGFMRDSEEAKSLELRADAAISQFNKEMQSLRVPNEAKTLFGKVYRRVLNEADFITKSALGWFSGSYNFGNNNKKR